MQNFGLQRKALISFKYPAELSNCLGGPFGEKWADVKAELNERSEVHSSADGGQFFHEWNDQAVSL